MHLKVHSECQYLFQGIQALLPDLKVGKPERGRERGNLSELQVPLLIVSSKGRPFADLGEMVLSFKREGYQHIALLGDAGEATFLSECGYPPEVVIRPQMDKEIVAAQIMGWMRGEIVAQQPKRLTTIERSIILHSLKNRPAHAFKGVALKTFYSHRMNGLRKLGLNKLRDLMINSLTGEPTTVGRYQRFFSDEK